MSIYIYKEKRKQYNKVNNLEYIKIRQEYLNLVINNIVFKKEDKYALFILFITQFILNSYNETLKEIRRYFITTFIKLIKINKTKNNDIK